MKRRGPGPESSRESQWHSRLARWFELPLYRERFERTGFTWPSAGLGPGDVGFEAVWQRVPFLSKPEIREDFPRNVLRGGQALEALLESKAVELEYTSGTAGERAAVLLGHGWWNEQEDRALRLNAFIAQQLDEHPSARRAVITTPSCNGLVCPSKWVPRTQRTLGTALYVNQARIPFLLKDQELEQMACEIAEWAPLFLDLDPVHGAWLALFCERRRLKFPSVKFIVASYEFVSAAHRRILERVFRVPVFNLYGSTETGHLMMEDTKGEMLSCPENAFLEIVDADAGGVGDLVVTTLTNDFMPLVRYRIGDLVEHLEGASPLRSKAAPERYCVHGRIRDSLRAGDGSRVTTAQVDACLAGVDGVMHYQLRQGVDGGLAFRYVPERRGPSRRGLGRIVDQLAGLLQVRGVIATEAVSMLPPAPSGKFRLTVAPEGEGGA